MQITLKDGEIFHDRYRVISRLGSGGMGSVFLVEQLALKRKVALKIMHRGGSQEDVERFHREFKMLSGLSHDNIVIFYSAAIDPGDLPYAVCEFIDGKSLREVLAQETKLPWNRVLKIATQICDAMSYAHALGLVHRDLKPENIMITNMPESDTVKIIDFGLGKNLIESAEKGLTKSGLLMGSPYYMSPEQALGGKADGRSDIYALACVIFESLTGRALFDAHSPIGVLHKHASEEARPELELAFPAQAKPLVSVLEKSLSKNADSRYQKMAELKSALEKLALLDILPAPSSATDSPNRKSNKIKFGAVIVVMFFVVAVLIVALARHAYLKSGSGVQPGSPAMTSLSGGKESQIAALHKQLDRYMGSMQMEKSKERRQALVIEMFRQLKLLLFLEKDKGVYAVTTEATIKKLLQYSSEMDDSSMIRAILFDELAQLHLRTDDYVAANRLCEQGLKQLSGKGNEKQYALRLLSTEASAMLMQYRFVEASQLVSQFRNFSVDKVSLHSFHNFSEPGHKESRLTIAVRDVWGTLQALKLRDDSDKRQAVEILNDLSAYLISEQELEYALPVVTRTRNLLDQLSSKSDSSYRRMSERTDNFLAKCKLRSNEPNKS